MPETFGQALRRLRGKMSLRDLACRANCAKSYIFDLENGRRRPSPSVAAALDVALSADGELVGLAGSLEPPSLSDGAEGIFTFDSPHLSTKKAISPPRNVGLKDVSVIREVLRGIAMSDRQFGGGHGRVYATEYLSDVVMPRLHSHAVKEVRRDLFTVSIEFALRVAAMHLDAGSTPHPDISSARH